MILFLDTTDRASYVVAVMNAHGGFEARRTVRPKERRGDVLFNVIAAMVNRSRLTGVIVVSGPGHFSGVRHGVTVANTLAYALRIPVVGVEKRQEESEKCLLERGLKMVRRARLGTYVVPMYGTEPNIG